MRAEENSTVLVVDDDPSIVKSLIRILTKAGYIVDAARSGSEAIRKLKANTYDAAILDLELGDMEGTEVLWIVQKTASRMLRIILTGTPMPEGKLEETRNKADVFLLKPVKPEQLLAVLSGANKVQGL